MHQLTTTQLAARLRVCRQHVYTLFDKHGQPRPDFASPRMTLYSENALAVWVERLPPKYAERFHESATRTSGSNQSAS